MRRRECQHKCVLVFIILVLTAFTMALSHDSNRLVVQPIEQMVLLGRYPYLSPFRGAPRGK